MITLGMPCKVATMTTRVIIGSKNPEGSKLSCRGDVLPIVKVIWNPLRSRPLVTSTLCSASINGKGAGIGAASGPMNKVRCVASNNARSRNAVGQCDGDLPADVRGQLLGPQPRVRVTQTPELLGVADESRGDVVEPVT